MELSIKKIILQHLHLHPGWQWGGQIEDYIRSVLGAKASNASRRLRELENEGKVEVQRVRVNGKGPKVTQYRLKEEEAPRPLSPTYSNGTLF